MSHPKGYRRTPGSFNRSKMLARLKRQAKRVQPGVHGPRMPFWTSDAIMRAAGQPGMLSVRHSRRVCGYRWASPSKYP